jgi:hypothetical protein
MIRTVVIVTGCSIVWLWVAMICGVLIPMSVMADTGNCKKSEILRLAQSGFTREEINEICREVTDSPNCCCAETYGSSAGSVLRRVPERGRESGRVYFVWQSADLCGYRSNYMCVDAKYCGRD